MGYLYEDLTRNILGTCFEVSNELGSGFLESVYQLSLGIAFADRGIRAIPQARMEVRFRQQCVGEFLADFLIENCVILEIKAVEELLPIHMAQVINYLKASRIEVGLLVNFGRPRLQHRRLENPSIAEMNRMAAIKNHP